PGLTITDPSSANLVGATVSISGGFYNDHLSFTNQFGITGVVNGGVLTLTGTASVANYQAALRSVMFINTNLTPNTTTRTVTFVVNDGTSTSNSATRNINITP